MAGKAFRAAEKHVEKYPSAGTDGTRYARQRRNACDKRSTYGAPDMVKARTRQMFFCGG